MCALQDISLGHSGGHQAKGEATCQEIRGSECLSKSQSINT